MPGAVILSQTRQTQPTRGSEGPPTGFLENIGAAARIGNDETSDAIALRKVEAYAELGEALVERGVAREQLTQDLPWLARVLNTGSANRAFEYSPDRVWEAAKAAGLPDLPDTREEFDQWVLRRRGGRDRDQSIVARGQGIGATVGSFAGSSSADMADSPLGPMQFLVGAGGPNLASVFLRNGAIAAIEEGYRQPERIANREQMGEQTSAGQVAFEIGSTFVFAGAISAGGRALGDNWDVISSAPRAVQERVWASILDRTPGLREKVGSTIDWDALNPHMADIAEATIAPERMTDAERGAIATLRREAEIDAANPFVPDGAGRASHYAMLGDTLRGILSENPTYVPKVTPNPAARLRGGTSVASGVVPAPRQGGGRLNLEGALDFILELEGGAKLVTDTGGLTKYGISSKANPGVDVRNLTEAQAREIYRRSYAAPLGLENYPADVALVALDAKINHRGGFAEMLLREAGDDPAKMIALRRGEYARLIREAPGTYAKFKNGWENRLQALERRLGLKPGEAGAASPSRGADAPDPEADFTASLDGELADTQAAIAQLEGELDAGARGISDVLEGEAPDAVPVADATPLPRVDEAPASSSATPVSQNEIAGLTSEARAIIPELRRIVDNERDVSLNKPAELAARLGVDERNLGAALQQLAVDGLVVQSAKGTFSRLPRRKDGPTDLWTWIAMRGGIADNEGHDLGTIFEVERWVRWKKKPDANGQGGIPLKQPYRTTRPALVPGVGPIVRREAGMSVDDLGLRLWEAGYLGQDDVGVRPTESQVIEFLQNAWGSGKKVYSIYDDAAVIEASNAAKVPSSKNPFHSEFQDDEHFTYEWSRFDNVAYEEFGFTLDEEAFAGAWREFQRAGDGDMAGAVLRAIQREIEDAQALEIAERGFADAADIIEEWEAALRADGRLGDEEIPAGRFDPRDPGPDGPPRGPSEWEETGPLDPERWQAWDEPDGPAAVATVESLEHDVRAGVERTEFGLLPEGETRGQGVQYHGARGELPDLHEGYYNPNNIYGGFDTFYTTDAVSIASGYQRKNSTGMTYRVDEIGPITKFDMEERLAPEDVWALFNTTTKWDEADGFPASAVEAAIGEDGRLNLREAMDEARDQSGYEGYSKDDVQEIFDGVIHNLKAKGFGGMTHIGGLKTGKDPHLVQIYFNAPEQLRLVPLQKAPAASRQKGASLTEVPTSASEDEFFAAMRDLPDNEATEDLLAAARSRVWEAADEADGLDAVIGRFDAARERWDAQFDDARAADAAVRDAQFKADTARYAELIVQKVEAGKAVLRTNNPVRKKINEYGPGTVRVRNGSLEVVEGRNWVAIPITEIAGHAKRMGISLDDAAVVGRADPNIAARQKQEAQLRAEAPLRGTNKTGQEQDGTMGTPLFDAADEPTFRLDEEGDPRAASDLLDEFDQDADFLKTIRDCL